MILPFDLLYNSDAHFDAYFDAIWSIVVMNIFLILYYSDADFDVTLL